ncbi:MAG: cell division ATP-binding protein FtsE [Candidatus Marinimicrobia bacterium]|nr:cell division ATP-binding protein FtsE [Candidatus Neomarinimicrobiota bacterium]|tara:strand:- start:2481 stop:3146 length:666 start_codon:yes stop_codon:yes gene_type:complete
MEKKKILKFSNVTATYANGCGIFDISFELNSSDMVFLMGPTGSGKSTLLKTIYKELDIDSGTVFVDNKDISKFNKNKTSLLRRDIGVIFQDFKLLNDRTVWENISLPLKIAQIGKNEISSKTSELIEAVGLAGKEKSLPEQLSGGEKQRVAIARAMVKEPKILLADEPTGNLDPNISMEILELLEMATDFGTCVIMCTHNYPLIKYKKREFIELHNGRVRI